MYILMFHVLLFILCLYLIKMAYELHGMLSGDLNLTTWEKVMPAYGGQPESFLNNVVTPIYRVISEVLLDCTLLLYLFLTKN